jgi:flagellar biosynthesis protein FliP
MRTLHSPTLPVGKLTPGIQPPHTRPARSGNVLKIALAVVAAAFFTVSSAFAQQIASESAQPNTEAKLDLPETLAGGPEKWTSPEGLSSSLKTMLVLGVLSLAPAALLMTTCYVRIVVVLGLLRQALGAQQLPPAQVTSALALFLTLIVMWPVWKQTYDGAVVPYTEKQIGAEEAWQRGTQPIRRFMAAQIEHSHNSADVYMFYKYLPQQTSQPQGYDDVPLQVLLPAFLLSELKTAFLIGFKIFLPFIILDLVVASVTTAMGMMMLPPALISLPFKLLLFVLVDGWHLVVEMLLQSFQVVT